MTDLGKEIEACKMKCVTVKCFMMKLNNERIAACILKDVDIQNMECDPFNVDLIYSSGTFTGKYYTVIHSNAPPD